MNKPSPAASAATTPLVRRPPSETEDHVPDDDLLTDEEVVARYKGRITLGTLRNWRALRIGPPYIKAGKAVLYSRAALQAWDKRNTVTCSKPG
jgi:hypothetical protein